MYETQDTQQNMRRKTKYTTTKEKYTAKNTTKNKMLTKIMIVNKE